MAADGRDSPSTEGSINRVDSDGHLDDSTSPGSINGTGEEAVVYSEPADQISWSGEQDLESGEKPSRLYKSIPREEAERTLVKHPHQFPGWGTVRRFDKTTTETFSQEFIEKLAEDTPLIEGNNGNDGNNGSENVYPAWLPGFLIPIYSKIRSPVSARDAHKLGQFRATAIAGNDITSSCLYVAGICTVSAGIMAPISLVLVVSLLFLFRSVYGEVGTALPLNGGTYTVLLNTTTKFVAALAAALTILSYVATAVVSASSAASYLVALWDGFPLEITVIVILTIFALLALAGTGESAGVALMIFVFHLTTLLVLVVTCIVYVCYHGFTQISDNITDAKPINGNYAADIFFGFSAALLGVSGFESSANYIEEQRKGVFVKTLRNMWACVAFFNPLISLLSFCILPTAAIMSNSNDLLAAMGFQAGGTWLQDWVSVDAAIVLSGSVLTSFVGVNGLAKRMAFDRCLPQFFVQENSCRHTNHWIILGFWVVTCSLYLVVGGNVNTLSGVYSIAFVSVMILFAVGNMLLKYKRDALPRDVRAWWSTTVIALCGVVVGLIGEIIYDPEYLAWFALYFALTFGLVMTMFLRSMVLSVIYTMIKNLPYVGPKWSEKLKKTLKKITSPPIVFFVKRGELHLMNKAMLYIRVNEQCTHVKFIHCYHKEEEVPEKLVRNIEVLDEMYPKMRVDLILWKGPFDPRSVRKISKHVGIPVNFMFMSVPDERFPNDIGELGGLRLITALR